jgi:hypothetical protein
VKNEVCLIGYRSAERNCDSALGQSVDPLIGTWKLNLEKSTNVAFRSLTLTWTGEGQNLIDTADGVTSQGQPFHVLFRHIYDGQPHPTTGSADYDSTTYTRIGNTINYVRFKQGKVVEIGQGVIVPARLIHLLLKASTQTIRRSMPLEYTTDNKGGNHVLHHRYPRRHFRRQAINLLISTFCPAVRSQGSGARLSCQWELLLTATMLCAFSTAALADEMLKFRNVYHVVAYQQMNAPDIDGHTVGIAQLAGLISMPDGTVAQWSGVSLLDYLHGAGAYTSYATITFSDGSALFTKEEGKTVVENGKGTVSGVDTILGGKGRYAGAKGDGSAIGYRVTNLSGPAAGAGLYGDVTLNIKTSTSATR